MRGTQVFIVCAVLVWQAFVPVFAAEGDSFRLEMRLPFGSRTPQPLHLALAMRGASSEFSPLSNHELANMDISASKPLNAYVAGVPVIQDGKFVLNAADNANSADTGHKGLITAGVIVVCVVVIASIAINNAFKHGGEEFEKNLNQQ